MPVFTIETPSGRKVKVEAPDEATAVRGAQEFEGQGFGALTPVEPGIGDRLFDAAKALGLPADRMRREARNVDALVRGAADVASFGFADEISAGLGAATGIGGEFLDYGKNLEMQRAIDREDRSVNPVARTTGQLAGGIAQGVMLGPGLMANAPALELRALGGAATGAAAGGTYGFGSGEGFGDRMMEAGKGAGIGAALGAAIPIVSSGIGNAYERAMNYFKPRPAPIADMSRGAINRVNRALIDDGMPDAAQFGPEGMLADVGDNLKGQAGAIANSPGQGQRIITRVLDDRKAGAPARIKADMDAALGPSPNVPAVLEKIRKNFGARAKPLYDEFRNTPVPYTRELEDIVETLKNEPIVLRQARRLVNLDDASGPRQFFADIADDGVVSISRVPNAAEWDYIKRALDGMERGARRQGDANGERIFGTLSKRVRDTVDRTISPGNPSQSIYARARAASAEGFGLRDAFEEGQEAFKRTLTPDQMRADMASMSQPEKLAYMTGARSQVANTVGNAGTSFGPNGDSAARRMLGSEYAREKVGIIAGDDKARMLVDRLDKESAFERTRQAVTQNSATAKRLAAQKEFPGLASGDTVGRELGGRTATGLAMEGVYRALNAMMGGMVAANRDRVAADAARLLTAQGPERNKIVTALIAYANGRNVTAAQKRMIENFSRRVLDAGRLPAVSAATD